MTAAALPEAPKRIKLPDTRASITRKNAVGNQEFYVIVGFYEDDVDPRSLSLPAEVFIHVAKEGSTLAGLCDMIATTISIALQYGVPWETLSAHYKNTSFEPKGRDFRNTQDFSSLGHAIAVTVDEIITHKRSLWGEQEQRALTGASQSSAMVSGRESGG